MHERRNRSCKAEHQAILIEKHRLKVATVHQELQAMLVVTTHFGSRETAPRRSATRYRLRSSTNRKTVGIPQEPKNREIEWCVDTATIVETTEQPGGSKTKGPAHTMIPNSGLWRNAACWVSHRPQDHRCYPRYTTTPSASCKLPTQS